MENLVEKDEVLVNIKVFLLKTPLRHLWMAYKRLCAVERKRNRAYFDYDEERFWKYAACNKGANEEESLRASITVDYHVVEKGLTMPARRLAFGKELIRTLIGKVRRYVVHYGAPRGQVVEAVAVIKAYFSLHEHERYDFQNDPEYWNSVREFVTEFPSVESAQEMHVTRAAFYAPKDSAFSDFAKGRHCIRNYDPRVSVSMRRIESAIDLARTTPSACNRQHSRVYCLTNKETIRLVLELQGGNRGFGHLADKVLVVVSDLRDITSRRERNDAYVNGGMFLMNLCYALYYYEVAHCILTWGQEPENDRKLRKLIPLRPSEEVVALLSCGEMPAEVDVANSPRKELSEIYRVVE